MSSRNYSQTVHKLKHQGDDEYCKGNYQEAYGIYKRVYEKSNLCSDKMRNKNSGVYRRLALTLGKINDIFGRNTDGELKEAKKYAKLYLKIKHLHNKTPKNENELCYICGNYYMKVDKFSNAIQKFEETKKIQNSLQIPDNQMIAATLNNLAILYEKTNQKEMSFECFKVSRNIYKNILGENHPMLALIIYNQAYFYYNLNHKDKALKLYEKCKNIWEKKLYPNHSYLVLVYNSIGTIYYNQNEQKKALDYYKKCKKIIYKFSNSDNLIPAVFYKNLGNLYITMNKPNKAFYCYEEYRKKVLNLANPDGLELSIIYYNLGCLYFIQDKYQDSFKAFEICKEIQEKLLENETNFNIKNSNINNKKYETQRFDYKIEALKLFEKLLCFWNQLIDPNKKTEDPKTKSLHEQMELKINTLKFHKYEYSLTGNSLTPLYLGNSRTPREGRKIERNVFDTESLMSNSLSYKHLRVRSLSIPNKGNTCFINTTLQILVHLPIVFSKLSKNTDLSACLENLLNCMKNRKNNLLESMISTFLKALEKSNTEFKTGKSGDVKHLLNHLLSNQLQLYKWTRRIIYIHKGPDFEHNSNELNDSYYYFSVNQDIGGNNKSLNSFLLSKFFDTSNSMMLISCKKCQNKQKGYIKILYLNFAKILILEIESKKPFLLSEVQTLTLYSLTYELMCITIIEEIELNTKHTYLICKELTGWKVYNDYLEFKFTESEIKNCNLLIYVLVEPNYVQITNGIVHALAPLDNQNTISLYAYIVNTEKKVINLDPIIFLVSKKKNFITLKNQVKSAINVNFSAIKNDFKIYLLNNYPIPNKKTQETILLALLSSEKLLIQGSGQIESLGLGINSFLIIQLI
ncbi:hypothetical protein SteCoe_22440 [Stentor coeruleus]|uniref:USP domain-containing protein n=1 Tax=Stentor coeruleus TaxID=5963 RepID=A0A1R2BM60_9CILI|nr:hypothetical protein SteCoe_22440 [Stentor coeruleus]